MTVMINFKISYSLAGNARIFVTQFLKIAVDRLFWCSRSFEAFRRTIGIIVFYKKKLLQKYLKYLCLNFFYQFSKLLELSWMTIFFLLPADKFWQITRLIIPLNTTLHCNWYEQLTLFVFIVLPRILEFIHKDMTFLEN